MKYHITTYGCQMNRSDSERIATMLHCMGYESAPTLRQADIIVINSCSVRQSAIDRIYGQLRLCSPHQKTILTGCVLPKEKEQLKDKFDFILDIKNLIDLPNLVGYRISDKIPMYEEEQKLTDYLDIVPEYQNTFSANVPIMTGCNNFCTYCAVPYTRGREISRSMKEIIREVKHLIDRGYKEIWLLGQNVNSYSDYSGVRPPNKFPDLLRLINKILGDFWIRFTSPHPKDFSDNLINTLIECEKVTEYINLPVQAGDNEILKKMNRPYTIEHYKDLVRKIRDKNPSIAVSTDVIVGFPGETKKQFQNTVKLFEDIQYDMAYISQYSSRPGTAASRLNDNVSRQEKIRRDKVLTKVLRKTALEQNQKYLNQNIEVLVDKERNDFYLGKTRMYKTVKFLKTRDRLIGKFVKVNITDIGAWGMKGILK